MSCCNIQEFREHLYCEIEIDEYNDGHFSIECKTCNKVLLSLYPLILPEKIKKEVKHGRKNYHIRRS